MEESITVRVDKQVASLLNITVWSNLFCIVLLVVVNWINASRGNLNTAESAEGAVRGLLSPEILLLLSVVCIVWLIVRIVSARRVFKRMERVYLCIEGDTVSGVSLPEPAASSHGDAGGRPFTLKAAALSDVFVKEITMHKKQVAPALFIRTDLETYVVPGIANIQDMKVRLLRMMDAVQLSAESK